MATAEAVAVSVPGGRAQWRRQRRWLQGSSDGSWGHTGAVVAGGAAISVPDGAGAVPGGVGTAAAAAAAGGGGSDGCWGRHTGSGGGV